MALALVLLANFAPDKLNLPQPIRRGRAWPDDWRPQNVAPTFSTKNLPQTNTCRTTQHLVPIGALRDGLPRA
eukprot:11211868-Lingulodinium_polyedra.AAC.1